MNAAALYLCMKPGRPLWQLGTGVASATGELWLIGWSRHRDAVDAAVPAHAATAIAAALTLTAQITFLAVGREYPVRHGDSSIVEPLERATAFERLSAWMRQFPTDAVAVTTREAGAAQGLFEATTFDWRQQRQLVLLTVAGSPAPRLTAGEVGRLSEDDWIRHAQAWAATTGGVGVMRPGVDGDVAGLLCLNRDFAERFRRSLIECAHAVHASMDVLGEEQFMDRIARTA